MTNPSWYSMTISKAKWQDTADAFGKWLNEIGAREWCIGEEVGLGGFEHLQVVVHFKKGVEPKKLQASIIGLGHCEPSITHDFDYAKKTGNWIGSWEGPIGKYKYYKLRPWQKTAVDTLKEQDDRSIMVIVDKEGGAGKSTLGRYLEATHQADVCPVVSDEYNDYTAYCIEYPSNAYVFDIPRAINNKKRNALWAGLEQIKNGCLFEKRYKPRKIWINPPKVLIYTNDDIPVNMLTMDRWHIYTPTDIGLEDITHQYV